MAKIFLDPGHGGNDPGAVGRNSREKDNVLKVFLRLRSLLQEMGHTVKMSRTTDKFVTLSGRAKMANDWGADIFISGHNNSATSTATGFETFIYNRTSNMITIELQNAIHNPLAKSLGIRDRGKKKANFAVLRLSKMPAVLIEYAFISNVNDEKILINEVEKLAVLTAEGIRNMVGGKAVSTKSKSVKIRTGGLSNKSLVEVVNYMRSKGWYGQIMLNKKGNPTLLTGGLNPSMRKDFETWLKKRGWWYKIE